MMCNILYIVIVILHLKCEAVCIQNATQNLITLFTKQKQQLKMGIM